MLTYKVEAHRIDSHGSIATTKQAQVILDTDLEGRVDAFNPVELLLAALAACIVKGIERVRPMIHFELDRVELNLIAERQDTPPMLSKISYELAVGTQESDLRLELLHTNVRKYGTIFNTLAAATEVTGSIRRLE